MELSKHLEQFKKLETPFYFYDINLLKQTIEAATKASAVIPNALIHFAVKANDNSRVLAEMNKAGFGLDTVSGGEITKAVGLGFAGNKIMFAGVGKTDKEILAGIDNDILSFNIESVPE